MDKTTPMSLSDPRLISWGVDNKENGPESLEKHDFSRDGRSIGAPPRHAV